MDNLECINAYRDILHSKLSTMHILTYDANDDSDAVQRLVDSYIVQLNDAMHDTVTEAGCKQKHCNKQKRIGVLNSATYETVNGSGGDFGMTMIDLVPGPCMKHTIISKKVFRRRTRQCVDRSVNQ